MFTLAVTTPRVAGELTKEKIWFTYRNAVDKVSYKQNKQAENQ